MNYYKPEQFSQLQEIISNYKIIREEFMNLQVPVMKVDREEKHYAEVISEVIQQVSNGSPYGWVKGWGAEGGNDKWLQLGLYAYDNNVNELLLIPFFREKMPKTFEMIKRLEGVFMCALVNLKPRTILTRHSHPYIEEQSLLQLHLPLVTAQNDNYNYINCNGEFKQHIEGVPIIFDGSLDHFALNESDEDRIILYIEFKRTN